VGDTETGTETANDDNDEVAPGAAAGDETATDDDAGTDKKHRPRKGSRLGRTPFKTS